MEQQGEVVGRHWSAVDKSEMIPLGFGNDRFHVSYSPKWISTTQAEIESVIAVGGMLSAFLVWTIQVEKTTLVEMLGCSCHKGNTGIPR